MFARLLPRSAPYFTYFKDQNAMMRQMAELLINVINVDKDSEEALKEMSGLEDSADALQRKIIQELSQTFITPIDREDIYAICTGQERAIDSIHGLGTRFFLFSFVHVRFPAERMVRNIIEITKGIDEMLDCLIAEKDSSGPVTRLQKLKDNSEMLLGVGLGELLDLELDTLDQVKQLMAWNQVYDRIEQTTLLLADLVDTLEQVVLKYA